MAEAGAAWAGVAIGVVGVIGRSVGKGEVEGKGGDGVDVALQARISK